VQTTSNMGNQALRLNGNQFNGRTADIAITTHGSDFYFAVCAVMGVATLAILAASFAKPATHRTLFYITAAINLVSTIAYFAMGSNLGWAPVRVEFVRFGHVVRGTYRQVFWARHINWFITSPLILLDLMFTAGLPLAVILWIILLDWVMVICGLVAGLIPSTYKFGFFTFACVIMCGIFLNLIVIGMRHAKALGSDILRVYTVCSLWIMFFWLLYPIAWGLSEGGNVISPDSEAVFYGVLDMLSIPAFSALFLIAHWDIDPARLGLRIRGHDEKIPGSVLEGEKQSHGQEPIRNTNGGTV